LVFIEEKHIEDWISEPTMTLLNQLLLGSVELDFAEEASLVE